MDSTESSTSLILPVENTDPKEMKLSGLKQMDSTESLTLFIRQVEVHPVEDTDQGILNSEDVLLPAYRSPNNSNVNGEAVQEGGPVLEKVGTKRRKLDKKWRKCTTYQTEREALDVIAKEELWSQQSTNTNALGERVYYRCSKIKERAKQQCNSGLYILYHNDSALITIFRSDNEHNHEHLLEQAFAPITGKLEIAIRQYLEQGLRLKEIMNQLQVDNLDKPSKNQLNYFIDKVRKEKIGNPTIKLSELVKFLSKNSVVPEDCNAPFVVDYKIKDTDDIGFDFLVSSKKLLSNSIGTKIIVADTTCKIRWQGFPVSPIGTVDQDMHFHLIGMGVSTNGEEEDFTFFFETIKNRVLEILNAEVNPHIIMCDASKAISNAFLAVFGNHCIVLMCWLHMKAAVKKIMGKYLPKEIHDAVLRDIDYLQLSRTAEIFENASQLFLNKYAEYKKFIEHFQYEWLEQNRNWYEGAAQESPSTNNALQCFNRHFKQERTLRARLPLQEFSEKLFSWIESCSLEYDSGKFPFATTPSITLDLWTKGYQWSRLNKVLKKITDDTGTYIIIPPGDELQLTNWIERTNWNTFEEFKVNSFGAWKVYINQTNWMEGKCTCPAFHKQYMCKHVLGIALRLQYVTAPPEAKPFEIGSKRKRGRPTSTKSKKALVVQ